MTTRTHARTLALTLLAASAATAGTVPLAVEKALRSAVGTEGARLEVTSLRGPSRCEAVRAEVDKPIAASGLVPLRIEGHAPDGAHCAGLGVAEVRLFAPVWLTQRALGPGEAVEGSVVRLEREVRAGHAPLSEVAEGLVAARALPAGTILEAPLVQDPAWRPGASVRVVLQSGALAVVQVGRIVPCVPGRGCAVLPSGRRVEGRRANGELHLEMP
jgi:flagella basal body P-ring formation protein FlgA